MRTLIRQVIINDAPLATLGVVDKGVLAGEIDTPDPRPFLNLKWGARLPGMATEVVQVLTVWVLDDPNDYTRVQDICDRLRVLLPTILGGVDAVDGGWISQVRWDGDSNDLKDDGHRTITKQCNFTIIGSS
jgi:hypothetical protein